MKIGLTVTTHRSTKLRPNGTELLNTFFNSFRNSKFKYDYCIYVADNQSETEFEYPSDLNIKSFYIKDQSKTGITGAWNLSLHEAYMDGCDILWNFNDDIEFTEYTNAFIEGIINYPNNSNFIFGPLSDNGNQYCPNRAQKPSAGYKRLNIRPNSWHNLPNGFSFGFTRSFYEKYRFLEASFFPISHKLNEGDGKWGGQEGYFSILAERGVDAVLVNTCWLRHVKLRGWTKVRDMYK